MQQLITSREELTELFSSIANNDAPLGIDTETVGLHHRLDWAVGISLSQDSNSWYIPFLHDNGNIDCDDPVGEVKKFLFGIREEKTEPESIVWHNKLFDIGMIYRTFGLVFKVGDDTMAMAYVLGEESNGLKELCWKYFDYKMTDLKDLMTSLCGVKYKSQGATFATLDPVHCYQYACEDALYTQKLAPVLRAQLKVMKCEGIYKLEQAMTPVILKMNNTGCPLDRDLLARATAKLSMSNALTEREIYDEVGHPFKINSTKELPGVLFGELGLPVIKRSKKTQAPSTDSEVMDILVEMNPIVRKIDTWRKDSRLVSGPLRRMQEAIEENGRIYPAFKSIGAKSGRLTSASCVTHFNEQVGINFQNISKKAFEDSAAIAADLRSSFIAPEGWTWIKGDFSQIEYRIMASMAKEQVLIDGFRNGVDYHSNTASKFLLKSIDEITKEDRAKGKVFNFGLSYGMTS